MEAADLFDPLCRVLEPPGSWADGSHVSRVEHFRGCDGEHISVYATAECPALTVLAAYYGNRSGYGPVVDARHLVFTEAEVRGAEGELKSSPANDRWPPEYTRAHHDIITNHEEVSERIVSVCESEPSRVVLISRQELLAAIFQLAARGDVPERYMSRVRKRARRLLRDEPRPLYLELATIHPNLFFSFLDSDAEQQRQVRRYFNQDRELWSEFARTMPEIRTDSRFQ